MKPSIVVVDYGMGNLRSVEKALESAGANVSVSASPTSVRNAQAIVLPGVGAFGEAARRLERQKLRPVIENALSRGTPFLGICLGLQLLFERSEESPRAKGFGFLKGDVVRFRGSKKTLKVPHIGWNKAMARPANPSPWLRSIGLDRYFYFVHSYYPAPRDRRVIAATTSYGKTFCSAVAGEAYFACQFHPEKSGAAGLGLLRQFSKRVTAAC